MATITTRSGKGSPLTNNEVDANFTNLNTDKAELSGAAFTGAITTNSTFDGRDVATDGTKLDGIEASADVTDATNVTAAGALMDSELTAIASVKALNQGVATGDSPDFAALNVNGTATMDGLTVDGGAISFNTTAGDLDINPLGGGSVEIESSGTLGLKVGGTSGVLVTDDSGNNILKAALNGDISFYEDTGTTAKLTWDASAELLTTTGLDVTGTATMDGLSVSNTNANPVTFLRTTSSSERLELNVDDGHVIFDSYQDEAGRYGGFVFQGTENGVGTRKRMEISHTTGDISFYEDTGTTPKFFWDASAERLSVPTLSITEGSITTTAAAGDHTVFNSTGADADFRVRTGANTHSLYVEGNTANVGIGTGNPASLMHLSSTAPSLSFTDTNSFTDVNDRFIVRAATNRGAIQWYDDSASTTAELMTFLPSGNVGINISLPKTEMNLSANNSGQGAVLTLENSDTGLTTNDVIGQIDFYANDSSTNGTGAKVNIKAIASSGAGTNTALTFGTSDSTSATAVERMRIDASGSCRWTPDGTNPDMTLTSDGNLLVGKTSTTFGVVGVENRADGRITSTRSGNASLVLNRLSSVGDIVNFYKDGTATGSISVTASATAYNTSSDQRLKENIADADDAGSKIDSIQVRKYDWKVDGSHQDYGMIAQELVEIAPEAVSVPEDSEEMMGVDYSKLVPMLIKEIQSLRNRVAQLEE